VLIRNLFILALCSVISRIVECILTYLLNYFMVQIISLEANWFAASQVIPRISRNSKVHYRTQKCPPTVSILGQRTQSIIPH